MAEVKRRQRTRLQSAVKRRSTATCSMRDKEMEGVALESILQNFLTRRGSRRRMGTPSPTHMSPSSDSPKQGSLTEITSQGNLPIGDHSRSHSMKAVEVNRNEWNSAVDLMSTSPHKEAQSQSKENMAKDMVPPAEESDTHILAVGVPTHPSSGNGSSSSSPSGRHSSGRPTLVTMENSEEEQDDNNEEEAQKLREASKKVLHFQRNSRGSVSSGEHGWDNLKSPGPLSSSPRQRTFNEDRHRHLGETGSENLARYILSSQLSPKNNTGRRHTLSFPPKVLPEEEDDLWDQPPERTCTPTLGKIGKMKSEDVGLYSTNRRENDLTDLSPNSKKSSTRDPSSSSAEKSDRDFVPPLVRVPDEEEQNQEVSTTEAAPNSLQKRSPPKSPRFKTETYGFLNFFRRLGEKSKELGN